MMKLGVLVWLFGTVVAGSMYLQRSRYYVMFGDGVGDDLCDTYLGMNKDIDQYGEFDKVNLRRLDEDKSYLCFLPKDQKIHKNETSLEEYSNDELLHSAIRIINDSFDNRTCVFAYELNQDYWTFAYCFGDKIIQYHEDMQYLFKTKKHRAILPDFVYTLGRFPGATKKEVLIENQTGNRKSKLKWQDFQIFDSQFTPYQSNSLIETSTQKIIQHKLTNGENCDITRQPRSIDVIYKCDLDNDIPQILDVSEVQTCKYQMVIGIPNLCLLKGFTPVSHQAEEIRIDCKTINKSIDKSPETKSITSYKDFFKSSQSAHDYLFAEKGHKINLRDYIIQPIGSGFFLGYAKDIELARTVWGGKNLFFYNQQYESKEQFLNLFAQLFFNIFEWKIPSPIMLETNQYATLDWNDSFTVWYEMYDIHGELQALIKINRDGLKESKVLHFQLVDPSTFLDQNNDKVEITQFDGTYNKWNFQYFNRHKRDLQGNVVYDGDDIPTTTVYVTKTVNTEELQQTDENNEIQGNDKSDEVTNIVEESNQTYETTEEVNSIEIDVVDEIDHQNGEHEIIDEPNSIDKNPIELDHTKGQERSETSYSHSQSASDYNESINQLAQELGLENIEPLQKVLASLNLQIVTQTDSEPAETTVDHDEL